MPDITWDEDFDPDPANPFRFGKDSDGNAYIAIRGAESHYVTDSQEALRNLIREIKAGKADHLL